MAQLGDTLTTRDAMRRATADDIIGRCQAAAVAIQGGELDGIEVVSLGTLRDQVAASLMVKLPPPSLKHAEVQTPATIVTSAICPECALPVEITVKLTPALTVDDTGAEISVKAKSKALVHVHGQLSLPIETADGQLGMDDVVIDDLRLKILRAVADVSDAYDAQTGPPPSLDAIAQHMAIASDGDRGDLEESLYSYSQLEAPLVDVISAKGEPVTYVLGEAGIAMVEAADAADPADGDDQDDGEDLGEPVLA